MASKVVQYETGMADAVDAVGGAFLLEGLTDRLEATLPGGPRVDAMGGVVAEMESGYLERAIS